MSHISLPPFLITSTGNEFGDTGATSLSEALKSNTTLTQLNLMGEKKRKKTHKRHPSTNQSFHFLFTSTDNKIGERGSTSLSEALKSNTTLTTLNLSGEDKRKKTHKRHPSTIHSSFLITLTDNGKFGDSGAVPLSEALKSNTTLTKLDLSSEDKRKAIHITLCLSLVTNLVKSIGTYIHPKGGVALSEALKVNSSLTDLNLDGNNKKKTYMIFCSFFSYVVSTDCYFGPSGATALNEALKVNTTLTKLNLDGEHKLKE